MFRFNKTNLDVTASILPALNQPGRFYYDTNITYYVKLRKISTGTPRSMATGILALRQATPAATMAPAQGLVGRSETNKQVK